MNKKKLILNIVLSVVAVFVLVMCILFLNKTFISNSDGEIQIVLVDINGEIVSDKDIKFKNGDKLIDLLNKHYNNITLNDGMIMSIEEFETAPDWSEFITIYVDDEMSMVGLLDIQFTDGTKITFEMTKYVQN